jgi:hypothetical protein
MINDELAADYLERAGHRLVATELLFDRGAWADVVRESQELVELVLKGILRLSGVDPPRIHDVGDILVGEAARLPPAVRQDAPRLAEISRHLRRDRELAFYGAEDLTPGRFYGRADAEQALDGARFVVQVGDRCRAR